MLEAENWAIALELYEGNPDDALLLAHQLMAIKQCLKRGRKGVQDAIEGLDLAIDSLYLHTDFHNVSHKLYLLRLEGTIKPSQRRKAPRAWCEAVTHSESGCIFGACRLVSCF
jgi:hypothetical protein